MTTTPRKQRTPLAIPLVAAAVVATAGCAASPDTPQHAEVPHEAAAGATTDDSALETILDEVWELDMRTWPTWATYEGDRRYDDRLEDLSPEGRAAWLEALEALAARAEALDPAALSPMARDTRAMLVARARDARAVEEACRSAEWSVDGLGGPQADYPMMAVFFPVRDASDLAHLEARYRATERHMDQHLANLRAGLADGFVSTRPNVERALEQLDRVLATPLDDDPLLKLDLADGFTPDTSGLRSAIEQAVRPALARYRDVLADEILPQAREAVGVGALPSGAACYAASIAANIGPGFEPEVLHHIGLEQLALAHQGMLEAAAELGITATDLGEVMRLIGEDPAHYAESESDLLERNSDVVARADAALAQVFGRLPETPIEVRAIEAHRAPDAPAAYYYSAAEDGSRPAYYYVNTHEPQTRPLYNLEALALHEAVPGHHLQIAIAKELPEVHIWRRNAGQTAFVEGWALYAETLGQELDLYSSPLTRFGMHNYQAWRAARLVVDTGMHHLGWSREQALEFLRANVLLPEQEAANEIDRYIAWPGQALAYMVGRLEIERLRDQAREALGERFDLRAFHDAVLGSGAVPLTILREHIEAWVEAQR